MFPGSMNEASSAQSDEADAGSGELLPAKRWSPNGLSLPKFSRQNPTAEVSEPCKKIDQYCLDSRKKPSRFSGLALTTIATIPGLRPRPGFERSITSPELMIRRPPSGSNEQTPRASAFSNMANVDMISPSTSDQTTRGGLRRVSSLMLTRELRPLEIPPMKSTQLTNREKLHVQASEPEDILPPQVPPKSPRTESRASPRANVMVHSANSSVSTIHSNKSTSQITTPSKCSTQMDYSAELRNLPPQTPMTKSPGTPYSKFNKYITTRNHSPQPQRKESEDDPRSLWSKLKPPATTECSKIHSRGMSDTSTYITNRRHPGKATGIRKIRELVLGTTLIEPRYPALPKGYRSIEAGGKLSDADSSILKQQARKQAENYEILQMTDVGALSQVRAKIRNTQQSNANIS